MTRETLTEQNDTLVNLNQALHDSVIAHDLDRAMSLAIQRHKALIEIFEAAENNPSKLENLKKLATETSESLSQEKILLRAQSSKKRSDFLLRKSAIQAYMAPIAA